MNKARILIVEDQLPVARIIAISLQKLGYEIVGTTAFAHESIDLAERLRPDLVLMDIDLSDGTSGVEAAQLLRQNLAIPSVFVTGHADRATVQRAKGAEPFGYLVKPFEEFELQTTVETALHLLAVDRRLMQFSRAVEQSPASIVITDTNGCIEYVNPRFTEVTGFTAAEAIGQNPRVLKSGRQPTEYYRDLWTTIAAGREWRGEFCNRKKSGEFYWELASISPIRDDAGRITHFVAVKEDITERKRTEDILRESEARYRTLIENVGEGIGVVDLQETFIFANPAAELIFGGPAGALVGRSLRDFTHPGQFEKIAQQTRRRQSGERDTYEIEIHRPDGEHRTLLVTAVPQHDRQGQFASTFGVFRDITARKLAEEQLIESQAALQKTNTQLERSVVRARQLAIEAEGANRAKSAFLTSMSHELRTPLNVISGMAATLSEQTADAGQKTSLNLILESGQNLLGIIEEILDYSGFQAGKTRLESAAFNLPELVSHVVRLAGESVRRRRIDLTYWIAESVPAEVTGDSRRLGQVILNLLFNAVKFTDRGGVHLGVTARPHGPDAWTLGITVCDTGAGIAREDLGRLFQPFSQIAVAPDRLASGTGLGLVIARSYAVLMGGDIVVRSQPGRGSVFRCTVVVGQTPNPARALSSFAPAALRSRPVLIVAQDSRQRRLLAAIARSWNLAAVVCPESGVGAALRSPEPFTLAILDPESVRDRTGDLARWLAPGASGHTVPVAWLNRSNSPSRLETAAAWIVLPNPLDVAELGRALTNLVARTAAPTPVVPPPVAARLADQLPLRILAADDIRTNREVLRGIMAHLGYAIKTVENGAEVLAALDSQPFDLILLDVQMPVMDGLTAAREICRRQTDPARRPKMAAITANALPGDREKCLAAGMDDYMSKPVLPRHIEACLRRLFPNGASPVSNAAPSIAAPAPAEPPLVDRAHLRNVMEGSTPGQMAETLVELQAATCDDFQRIWPQVVAACKDRDCPRLAELTHGLKGCFLTLGWMRIARRCIDVLGEARKGEFAKWATFPAELKCLFSASTAAMNDFIAALAGPESPAVTPPAEGESRRSHQETLLPVTP